MSRNHTLLANVAIGLIRLTKCDMLLVILVAALLPSFAEAQLLRGRLRQQGPEVEAIAGEPFGVGRWVVELPPGVNPALLGGSGFTLTDDDGRVMYQAFQAEPVRTVARELLGRPQRATVYFLFTGDEPLELELFAPEVQSISVTPRNDAVEHARLLSDWWVKYARQANRITRSGDYPGLVDNYLLATLARRLNLPPASEIPPPAIRRIAETALGTLTGRNPLEGGAESDGGELDYSLALLLGGDDLRRRLQVQSLSRRGEPAEIADQPLPEGIEYQAAIPEVLDEVAVEPIAMHVPAECFYVRFGNFPNYLWFRHTMDRWSGDLQNLISPRGLDFGMTQRAERQLSLKESALAGLLGPAVIVDVAMIGNDVFFREGPAIGMLFQARNNFALASDFAQQRAATLEREPGATQKQVTIAGRQVSLLSTPDNRVRSFYATDGDFHLVTNSRHLVEQFFAAGKDGKSLGATSEFRLARSLMPVGRNDTVFAYLSGEFFRNLSSPSYQIEMMRRMRSAAEIDMAMVAELAAKGEGRPDLDTIDELIEGNFLPADFGRRADGSEIVRDEEGGFIDSIRGPRGAFLPVLDVETVKATPSEVREYQQLKEWFYANWSQFDPVVASIRRQPGTSPATEKIVIDAMLTPLAVKNYETLATALGPLSQQKLAPIAGNAATIEISFSGNLLAAKGLADPQGAYRFFAGVRDEDPNAALGGQLERPAPRLLGNVQVDGAPLGAILGGAVPGAMPTLPPFYFGAYPAPDFFRWLGVENVPLDPDGFGRSPSGMWQRREGAFTTASPSREILAMVTPQLRFVEAARPAQAWLNVGDLSQSRLAPTINTLFYRSAKNSVVSNLQFLHSLAAQLRVPPQEARDAAEKLVGAKLVCPLGGKLELRTRQGLLPTWTSTAVDPGRARLVDGLTDKPPEDFTAPILTWLHGLNADLALDERTLGVHAEVEMARSATGSGEAKPNARLHTVPIEESPRSESPKAPAPEDLPPPRPQPNGP